FGHRNCVILHGDQPGVRPSARRAAAPLSCAENARRARFFGNALATNFSYEATRRILSPARLILLPELSNIGPFASGDRVKNHEIDYLIRSKAASSAGKSWKRRHLSSPFGLRILGISLEREHRTLYKTFLYNDVSFKNVYLRGFYLSGIPGGNFGGGSPAS